ncbi:hypothetical protein ACLQ3K_20085 [Tsukamurella sp. DT100]|uniref:hypothetical protein n=1 Tax=Tsukamurella sp. DT100 TaxID=3393415 RepID=UPI003CF247CC
MPTEIPARWKPVFDRTGVESWRELSRRAGASVGVVQGVVLGTRKSTDEAVRMVANALRISIQEVYTLRGEPVFEPFVLPRRANLLNHQQRQAILAVIDGMLHTSDQTSSQTESADSR